MQTRTVRSASAEQAIVQSFPVSDDLGSIRSRFRSGKSNPLAEILTDDAYVALRENDLLNEKSLRDYIIRQMFLKLRSDSQMRTSEAIGALKEMYPYLQFDTIRKIVYRVYPSSARKSMI
ncbi:MAG TPA: hypothetical protein VEW28_11020 [Candidatus Kapabacteria bacterium]|nr:hypothetical protein [Candidatus Kapabacteria bacterium]